MLYRVATQTNTVPPSWQWKSTPLSSLDAVLRFLRLYRALPQDQIRVFSSARREDLNKQFRREQSAMGIHSVTAAQFLRERLISTGDATRETSEQMQQQNQKVGSGAVVISPSVNESNKPTLTLDGESILDCKRLKLELGTGGDHDLPYHFAFPPTWSQAHAWAVLLVQVHRGELQV